MRVFYSHIHNPQDSLWPSVYIATLCGELWCIRYVHTVHGDQYSSIGRALFPALPASGGTFFRNAFFLWRIGSKSAYSHIKHTSRFLPGVGRAGQFERECPSRIEIVGSNSSLLCSEKYYNCCSPVRTEDPISATAWGRRSYS